MGACGKDGGRQGGLSQGGWMRPVSRGCWGPARAMPHGLLGSQGLGEGPAAPGQGQPEPLPSLPGWWGHFLGPTLAHLHTFPAAWAQLGWAALLTGTETQPWEQG